MTKSKGLQERWTPDQDATLREMWLSGKPAITIALSMGKASDKAIWSRVKRLALKRSPTLKHAAILDYKEAGRGVKAKPSFTHSLVAQTAYGTPAKLLDVTGCRFIVHGIELCCNAECIGVYCMEHRSICYQPAKPRK